MIKRLVLVAILCFYPLYLFGDTTLDGKVVAIADGDTLTLLVDQVQHKI